MTIPILLKRARIVKSESGVRSSRDERHRVNRDTWEYWDSEGNEYRKAFEYKDGTTPVIPEFGTHELLNAMKYQYERKK